MRVAHKPIFAHLFSWLQDAESADTDKNDVGREAAAPQPNGGYFMQNARSPLLLTRATIIFIAVVQIVLGIIFILSPGTFPAARRKSPKRWRNVCVIQKRLRMAVSQSSV